MENPEETTTLAAKLKIVVLVEAVGLLIALIMPVTPSKTGKPFVWPASWGEYFDEVALGFLMVNGIYVVLFIVGWIYVKRQKKSSEG